MADQSGGQDRQTDRGGHLKLLQIAEVIAMQTGIRTLIIQGLIDGPNGLPGSCPGYKGEIDLAMLEQKAAYLHVGIYRVHNEDSLCEIIDRLQDQGGYRTTVINADGVIDPAYSL